MSCLCSSTCRRPTIWHGSTEYFMIYMKRDCEGRLPDFISKFLNERCFRVRVGSCLSDLYDQQMGVPQGAILSVTLFILKINSIIKCLPAGVRGSLYVDNFCICFRSKSLIAIERQIQRCLNDIQSNTVCMHFSQLPSANVDPDLKLSGASIAVVNEFKFLGLIFDKKLTFKQHIRYLKDRCFKVLNLLWVIAHKDWGADCATLLKLYCSLGSLKIRLWLCCVWFCSKVGRRVTGPSAECSIAYLSRSIQNVASLKPSCGGGSAATWAATPATKSTLHLQNSYQTLATLLSVVCLVLPLIVCSKRDHTSFPLSAS